MKVEEIENAIDALLVCQYCWADQVERDGEKISDYDAITQSIRCLKEYAESEKRIDCIIAKHSNL